MSRQLTWSHFIELAEISDTTRRLFYQQMSVLYRWSVRQLREQKDKMVYERTLVAAKPEDEQVKMLTTVSDGLITPDVLVRLSCSWEYVIKHFLKCNTVLLLWK